MAETNSDKNKKKKSGKTKLNFTIDLLGLALMIGMIGTGFIIRYTLPPGSGGRGGGHGLLLWGMDRHEWGGVHFWLSLSLIGLLILHVALHWSWVCNFVRRRAGSSKPGARISRRTSVVTGVVFTVFLSVFVAWFLMASKSMVVSVNEERPIFNLEQENEYATRHAPEHEHESEAEHGCDEHIDSKHHQRERKSEIRQHKKPRKNSRRNQKANKPAGQDPIRGYMTLREVSLATNVPVGTIKASLNLPASVSSRDRLGQLKRKYGFQMSDVREIVTKAGGVHE